MAFRGRGNAQKKKYSKGMIKFFLVLGVLFWIIWLIMWQAGLFNIGLL